jgi:RNA polymerase sigma-70 factor (ECF subfamily)
MPEPSAQFVAEYASCQKQLFAFLLALLGSPDQAEEVLQETNLVIWKKSAEFTEGTSFIAWSIRIARYQAMAYREKQGRDRLRFDDRATEAIASAYTGRDRWASDRLSTLEQCVEKLPENSRKLLKLRYRDNQDPEKIAERTGKTYRAIVQALSRVRGALADCVKRKEAGHG